MYLAELHGKLSRDNENKEDILTSNVFSFFKYTDRKIFLYELLISLGLEITQEDAVGSEFIFWPSYEDGTEPDLVIVVGNYYLVIETKYHSGFGEERTDLKHQLVREIEGGLIEATKQKKIFKIIVITAHYYEQPEISEDIPSKSRSDFIWLNWQEIIQLIDGILNKDLDLSSETRLFAQDLIKLLDRKNLNIFEGFKALFNFDELYESEDTIFFIRK